MKHFGFPKLAIVYVLFTIAGVLPWNAAFAQTSAPKVAFGDFLGAVQHRSLPRAVYQEVSDIFATHPSVTLVPRAKVLDAVKQGGALWVSAGNAAAVAAATGATVVIGGEVQETTSTISLTLRVFSGATGKPMGSKTVVVGIQELARLPPQACQALAQMLNLPKHDFAPGAANLTTLTEIGNGLDLGDQGKYADAAKELAAAAQGEEGFKLTTTWLTQTAQTGLASSKDPLERVRLLQLQGDTKGALAELEKVRTSGAYGEASRLLRAELLTKDGNPSAAASELAGFKPPDSKDPQVYFNYGKVLRAMGKVEESISAFQKAVDLDPGNIDALINIGELYQVQGDFQKAADAFKQVCDGMIATSNFQGAIVAIRRAKAILPKDPEVLAREGRVLLELGAVPEAIATLEQVYAADPKNVSVGAFLGQGYFLQGDEGKALKLLLEAQKADANSFEVNYYLGLIYSTKSDKKTREKALGFAERAVSLRPDHKDAALLLARLYRLLGMNEQAKAMYSKLRSSDGDNYLLTKETGDFLKETGDYQQAEVLYADAVRLNPDYLDANEGLGEVYRAQGKEEQLKTQVAKIHQLDPQAEFKDSVLSRQILSLVNTMPNGVRTEEGPKLIEKVAVISFRELPRSSFFERLGRVFSPVVPDSRKFLPAVERALAARFVTVRNYSDALPEVRRQGFSPAMLKDRRRMAGLCRQLGVDAVITVRVSDLLLTAEQKAERDETNNLSFRIDLIMFEVVGGTYHGNGVIIPVAKKGFKRFNPIPFVLFGAIGAVIAAAAFYLRTVGFGNVRVAINYDKEQAAGYFALKLSRRQNDPWTTKVKRTPSGKFSKKASLWTRNEEYMVGDLTEFKGFISGKYFVHLFGNIAEKDDRSKIIGTFAVTKPVTIQKGETAEVVFNLIENETYIELTVRHQDNVLVGAEVVCKETGVKVQTKAGQGAGFYVKPGATYRFTASYEDLRASVDVKVPDLKPIDITVQMHEGNRYAAQGQFEQAAEMFLNAGDEVEAARMFEKAGQLLKACRILGEKFVREESFDKAIACYKRGEDHDSLASLYQRLGDMTNAYRHFGLGYMAKKEFDEAAGMFTECKDYENLAKAYAAKGDLAGQNRAIGMHQQTLGQDLEAAGAFERGEAFGEAGEAYARVGNTTKAAEMFVKAADYERAAAMFLQAGDNKRAAMAYEKGGQLDRAAELYSALGDTAKAPKVMVDAGKFLDAARAYRSSGLLDEALAALRKVAVTHPDFTAACDLMASIFEEKGEAGLAVQATQRGLENVVIDNNNLDRFFVLGERQEKAGEISDAVRTYEKILAVNHEYKDLSHHVRELKESMQARTMMGASGLLAGTTAGTAPAAQSTRYEILKELGRGGMGIVYHAKDKLLEREVALKVLPEQIKDNPEALAAFLKEAKAAAKMQHHNLVTIFDTGQEANNYYITMELVEGQTLKQLLNRSPKQLRAQDVLTVALMVCDGLSYAHRNKIIHRDIKPSNIMIGKNRQVKIMDFGLATVMQKAALDKTMMRGTPLYMAPEMIMGRNVDYRSDVYSMGVTLYEMATKKVPFSSGDIAYHHLHTAPPPPSQFNAEIHPDLQRIILKAIAKKQEERYQSMDELMAELQRLQDTLKNAAATTQPAA